MARERSRTAAGDRAARHAASGPVPSGARRPDRRGDRARARSARRHPGRSNPVVPPTRSRPGERRARRAADPRVLGAERGRRTREADEAAFIDPQRRSLGHARERGRDGTPKPREARRGERTGRPDRRPHGARIPSAWLGRERGARARALGAPSARRGPEGDAGRGGCALRARATVATGPARGERAGGRPRAPGRAAPAARADRAWPRRSLRSWASSPRSWAAPPCAGTSSAPRPPSCVARPA